MHKEAITIERIDSEMPAEAVKVVVRCRPINEKEITDGRQKIVTVDSSRGEVTVRDPNAPEDAAPKRYTFDNVFPDTCTQRDVFDIVASKQVNAAMEGFNATIFAYGQTGTGKTYTMEGKGDKDTQGVIPNSFDYIFEAARADTSGREYIVKTSMLEIYNEEIRDLLGKDPKAKMNLREEKGKGVYVQGLAAYVASCPEDMEKFLAVGRKNRAVGATQMNQGSSRSHCVFMVTVASSVPTEEGESMPRVGKLNLVDLAGSERAGKTGAQAGSDRFQEGVMINASLSALGNVISALVDGKPHIPYRDSKLTRLLQDSLGGNTKTVMFAMLGPADWNYDETLSTLRYANRAKNIKNKPVVNEDPRDAAIREYQEEIAKLRAALARLQDEGKEVPGGLRNFAPILMPLKAKKNPNTRLIPFPFAMPGATPEPTTRTKLVPIPFVVPGQGQDQPRPVKPIMVPYIARRAPPPAQEDVSERATNALGEDRGAPAEAAGREERSGGSAEAEAPAHGSGERAKAKLMPVPFTVTAPAEQQGAADAPKGNKVVPLPVPMPAAQGPPREPPPPAPEFVPFFDGWSPLQVACFKCCMSCCRPPLSDRIAPGDEDKYTNYVAYAERAAKEAAEARKLAVAEAPVKLEVASSESAAWQVVREHGDEDEFDAIDFLSQFFAMPETPEDGDDETEAGDADADEDAQLEKMWREREMRLNNIMSSHRV